MTKAVDSTQVEVLKAGRAAQREINAARLAASTAWQAWRMYDTYQTPEGVVTSHVLMPSIKMPKPGSSKDGQPAIMAEIQTDGEHPEHKRLREIAETSDLRVLELEDQIMVMEVLIGSRK